MKIIWNEVTRFSQIVAIFLFVLIFLLGLFWGRQVGIKTVLGPVLNDVVFKCDEGKVIHSVFYERAVMIEFPEEPEIFLMQTISASGARYANTDESLVFWNKGDEALVMKNNQMDLTFKNCTIDL